MIKGIHTILVQTTDMDRSVAFYRDVIGLAPGYQSPYWSDFALGDKKLGIHPILRPDGDTPVIPFKNAVIGVETDDLRELRATLDAAGSYVQGAYHQTPGGAVLDFLDPDGNNWQAIQVGARVADLE